MNLDNNIDEIIKKKEQSEQSVSEIDIKEMITKQILTLLSKNINDLIYEINKMRQLSLEIQYTNKKILKLFEQIFS